MVALTVFAATLLAACGGDTAPTSAKAPGSSDASKQASGTAPRSTLDRYRSYVSQNYDDPSHWLCRPDTPDDACHRDLDTTIIAADGSTSVEHFEAAEDPAIDCFYVYPTISKDPTPFSDWFASDSEEGLAAYNQVARLRSQCRVFAPVYRQRTLSGLIAAFAGSRAPGPEGDPFADVLDAWRTYMARDNHGRGVVLVGHSQGSGMLGRLLEEEIDPNADVRAVLVGAYLAGAAVAVPPNQLVGGALQHIPICSRDGEIGCVTTWATFRVNRPPGPGALFGTVRGGTTGQEAACANPAGLSGGDVELHGYFPSNPGVSILSEVGGSSVDSWLPGTTITTPFVMLPDLLSGECVHQDGFHYLAVTVHPDAGPRADDITGDLTPQWGLHLVDVNVVMGDIIERVAAQAEAFAR